MLNYLLFVAGFVFLIKGADLLIKGASAISKKFKVPEMTIGLTVVAFGTSLPEFIVNIFSSIRGEHDLVIGNIAGSNVANILFILGVSALLATLYFSKNSFNIDVFVSLGTVYLLLLLVFIYAFFFNSLILSRFAGLLMLLIFIFYLFMLFRRKYELSESVNVLNFKISVLFLVLGIACLYVGGKWVVDGAVNIASSLGVSTLFIGTSIIALGTSLPEFITSIISVLKGKNDLAIGNVVGSNSFNILFILGISAIIRPVHFSSFGLINFLFVAFSTLIVAGFLLRQYIINKKYALNWSHGLILIGIYVFYIVYFLLK